MGVPGAIMYEAGMSFFGYGIPAPAPSLGNMISDARGYMTVCPWYILFPGITAGADRGGLQHLWRRPQRRPGPLCKTKELNPLARQRAEIRPSLLYNAPACAARMHLSVGAEVQHQMQLLQPRGGDKCLHGCMPGLTDRVLSPQEALAHVRRVREGGVDIRIVGIAGPGETAV